MGGDIGEIQLGSERELYKYIDHYAVEKKKRKKKEEKKSILFISPRWCGYSECMCVCVFFSHSFWTSRSLDVPAGVTQEEGHTGGKSYRIFHPPSFCGACLNFSREKDSAIPFPRRP